MKQQKDGDLASMTTPTFPLTPATPLPWELDDECNVCGNNLIVADCNVVPGPAIVDLCDQNAAYIVHACNAYPRLVVLLRTLIERHPAYVALNKDWHEADARLRELGELASVSGTPQDNAGDK